MPVAVAMLAAVIERKTPTLAEVAALTVLSAGVMLAVWEGSVTGSVTGVVLCVAALFGSAAMVSTTGKVRMRVPSWASGSTAVLLLQGAVPSFGVSLWGWPQAGLLCFMLSQTDPLARCNSEVQKCTSGTAALW